MHQGFSTVVSMEGRVFWPHSNISVLALLAKNKGQVPPGRLLAEPVDHVKFIPCYWSQALVALCCWAWYSLSYYIRGVAWFLQTPQIICLRRAQLNLQTYKISIQMTSLIILQGLHIPPISPQALSCPGIKPATPRWESRHFAHTANPIYSAHLAKVKVKYLRCKVLVLW